MATVLDAIVIPAFRLIRVSGMPGRGLSPEEQTEGLQVLNDLLDDFNTQFLFVYSINRILLNLQSNKQTYLAGIGSPDWNIPRPVRVEKASLIYSSGSAQPIELPLIVIDDPEWQRIAVKNIPSPVPQYLYPDGGFPYNGINFWPIPNVAYQAALYLWTQLSQYGAVTDIASLPPGYMRMLQYQLAVELAPRYEKAVLTPLTVQRALDAVAHVKSLNNEPYELDIDPMLLNSLYGFGGGGGGGSLIGVAPGGGGGGSGNVSQIGIVGAINGTNGSDGNAVFALSISPSVLQIYKNGLLATPGASYQLAGSMVTFLAGQIPVTGDTLVAYGG